MQSGIQTAHCIKGNFTKPVCKCSMPIPELYQARFCIQGTTVCRLSNRPVKNFPTSERAVRFCCFNPGPRRIPQTQIVCSPNPVQKSMAQAKGQRCHGLAQQDAQLGLRCHAKRAAHLFQAKRASDISTCYSCVHD